VLELRRLVADRRREDRVIRPSRVTLTIALDRTADVDSEASLNSAAAELIEEVKRRLPDLAAIEVVSVEPVERRRGERRRKGR
jgi:hypothetical protein